MISNDFSYDLIVMIELISERGSGIRTRVSARGFVALVRGMHDGGGKLDRAHGRQRGDSRVDLPLPDTMGGRAIL